MTLAGPPPSPGRVVVARPAPVVAIARLTWVLVGLGAALAALCVWRPDDLVGAGVASGVAPGDAYQPPTFAPVVAVLYVVVAALVVVLLRLVLGGHDWARHSLATTVALLAAATLATLTTSPPPFALGYVAVSVVLELVLLWLLYRPVVGRWMVA